MRTAWRRTVQRLLVLSTLASTGCFHHDRRGVDSWMPLAVGNEWTYEQSGMKTLAASQTFRIVREAPGDRGEERFFVGDSPESYYVRDPSRQIVGFASSTGIWAVYLRGPLALGERFEGGLTTNEGFHVVGEETPFLVAQRPDQDMLPVASQGYKLVTSFDRSVTVPAGTFTHCLEVTHIAGPIVGVKYFAPRVGLVLSEGWVEIRGQRQMISRQALTAYRIANQGTK
ncbi:MAG TPA: hypothetical protein VMV18_15020 [bacterium]|nr:hypothetical protein [bacterium]